MRIFIGYDERQPVAFNVLQQSILAHISVPVAITPLVLKTMPIKRRGLTEFTFTRFLVPYLCGYKGYALFLDADMLVRCDIAKELAGYCDPSKPVSVCKNKQRFEWASMMLFANERCTMLTPDYIENTEGLHMLKWCPEHMIGEIPLEYNHLVGYDDPNPDAKIVHYTQGIPNDLKTTDCEHAREWQKYSSHLVKSPTWDEFMGTSVHTATINGIKQPKYKEALNASN